MYWEDNAWSRNVSLLNLFEKGDDFFPFFSFFYLQLTQSFVVLVSVPFGSLSLQHFGFEFTISMIDSSFTLKYNGFAYTIVKF